MALYYLETSALVKLYVYEQGTEGLLRLASSSGNRFSILSLAQVEFRAAIRRQQRVGDVSRAEAESLLEAFSAHSEGKFLIQPLTDSVQDVALALLDAYPLKGYDAMQLAGYLSLRSISGTDEPVFVCADKALLAAARNEGCTVLDPTSH
jgi:uncharacterized protein